MTHHMISQIPNFQLNKKEFPISRFQEILFRIENSWTPVMSIAIDNLILNWTFTILKSSLKIIKWINFQIIWAAHHCTVSQIPNFQLNQNDRLIASCFDIEYYLIFSKMNTNSISEVLSIGVLLRLSAADPPCTTSTMHDNRAGWSTSILNKSWYKSMAFFFLNNQGTTKVVESSRVLLFLIFDQALLRHIFWAQENHHQPLYPQH